MPASKENNNIKDKNASSLPPPLPYRESQPKMLAVGGGYWEAVNETVPFTPTLWPLNLSIVVKRLHSHLRLIAQQLVRKTGCTICKSHCVTEEMTLKPGSCLKTKLELTINNFWIKQNGKEKGNDWPIQMNTLWTTNCKHETHCRWFQVGQEAFQILKFWIWEYLYRPPVEHL